MDSVNVFTLVGCGAAKKDEPTPARELYTSSYFAGKRMLAERGDDWGVYSAEHGLLSPDEKVEPYDTEMGELSAKEQKRVADGVYRSLVPQSTSNFTDVVVLAGWDYARPLKDLVRDKPPMKNYHFPFQDGDFSGMFEQQSWLKEARERVDDGEDYIEVVMDV